ncbi:MAG: hypothetical protein OCU12_07770 [Methanophagales archaeon]|nr:hypothetical protein [Methanophagales archaeon]
MYKKGYEECADCGSRFGFEGGRCLLCGGNRVNVYVGVEEEKDKEFDLVKKGKQQAEEARCTNKAAFSYRWLGGDKLRVCVAHGLWLMKIANVMGVDVVLESVDEGQCDQLVPAGSDEWRVVNDRGGDVTVDDVVGV